MQKISTGDVPVNCGFRSNIPAPKCEIIYVEHFSTTRIETF